jgi:hypothetical protein
MYSARSLIGHFAPAVGRDTYVSADPGVSVRRAIMVDCDLMAGFIILEDGRAYAASNSDTDATIRAIAAEVPDAEFREWLLAQQSEHLGLGMTSVDLREIAPQLRPTFYAAVRQAYVRATSDGFEEFQPGSFSTKAGSVTSATSSR